MDLRVKQIFVHPVKSMAGESVEQVAVTRDGLTGDRQFVVATPRGKCLTARECPSLVMLNVFMDGNSLSLSSPNGDSLTIRLLQTNAAQKLIRVWDDDVTSKDLGEEAAAWLSAYLERECRLYSMVKESVRVGKFRGTPNGFADATPILITSDASLDDLNGRLPSPVIHENFRPNIVVSGEMEPFAEDLWAEIRIGDVVIKDSWGCSRCILTTVDPATGVKSHDMEPLTTLRSLRPAPDKRIYFGQNVIPSTAGTIRIGDKVEILATRKNPFYMADGLL